MTTRKCDFTLSAKEAKPLLIQGGQEIWVDLGHGHTDIADSIWSTSENDPEGQQSVLTRTGRIIHVQWDSLSFSCLLKSY